MWLAQAEVRHIPSTYMVKRSSPSPCMIGRLETPPPVARVTPGSSLRSEAVSLVFSRLDASGASGFSELPVITVSWLIASIQNAGKGSAAVISRNVSKGIKWFVEFLIVLKNDKLTLSVVSKQINYDKRLIPNLELSKTQGCGFQRFQFKRRS